MNYQKEADAFYGASARIIKQEMKKRENYLPLNLPGEIVSVNGNFANVKINGSIEITPNIPVCPHITVSPGDHVWIMKINYNDNDLLIWTARPIS